MEYAAVAVVFAAVAAIVLVGHLVTATGNSGAPINQVVTPFSRNYRVVPTVNTGGYSSGKIVGGVQTINPATGVSFSALLESICLKNLANTTPAFTIYFFDTTPTGSYTDGASLSWASAAQAADFGKIIHTHTVATGDWIAAGSQATADYGAIGKQLVLTGQALSFIIAATGSFTCGTTADLTLDFNLLQEG